MRNLSQLFEFLADLRVYSYVVNAFFIALWLRQRLFLNHFLAGRWDGTLKTVGADDAVLHCTLLISEHRDRDNTALLRYERRDLQTGQVTLRGVDILDDYDTDVLFVFRRQWRPRFIRDLHTGDTNHSMTSPSVQRLGSLPNIYQWNCKIQNLFFRPKLRVAISGADVSFEGAFLRR